MGMFDWVEHVKPCISCGQEIKLWQTKSAICACQVIPIWQAKNIYTDCPHCGYWNQYVIEAEIEVAVKSLTLTPDKGTMKALNKDL